MNRGYPSEDLDFVLEQCPGLWLRHSGARLLITGGTGFIGSWLIQTLQRANDQLGSGLELVILSRDAEKARQQAPQVFRRADTCLLQADINQKLPSTGAFDLCIHAATDVGAPLKAGNPLQQFDTIVNGTRRVLDLAQASGAARFLLLSSGAIYGPQPPEMERLTENYVGAPNPLQAEAAYGNSKRAAEWLACAYAAQAQQALSVSIARIFAVIGPGLPLNGAFAAGNFIRDVIAHHAINIQGDGRPLRSFLYTSDLCIWLLHMLTEGQSGTAYNVGSEHAVSIADFARQVIAVAGVDTSIHIHTAVNQTVLPPRYIPDTKKARDSLHLIEYTPLDLALRKTIEWTRSSLMN